MKKFSDLDVGEVFYPQLKNGEMDLEYCLIKVGLIKMSKSPPWNIRTTPDVIGQKGTINSVVISSIDGKTNGYYDYCSDDEMVYVESDC